MNRPFLFGKMPEIIEGKIYYHLFKPVPKKYDGLFERARLKYARSVVMSVPRSRDYMYDCIALMGYFEPDLTRRVKRLAGGGGLMVDVGANVGYFSLIWLATNTANHCIAIEPSPLVIPYLKSNVEKNNLASRADIRKAAAGSKQGIVPFTLQYKEPTGWGRFAAENESDFIIEIGVQKIDDMVSKNQTIEFLKIDVEGGEALVIEGCQNLLERRQIRNIYVEQNKPGARILGIREDRVLQLLWKHGFKLERMSKPSPRGIDHWWGYIT